MDKLMGSSSTLVNFADHIHKTVFL